MDCTDWPANDAACWVSGKESPPFLISDNVSGALEQVAEMEHRRRLKFVRCTMQAESHGTSGMGRISLLG